MCIANASSPHVRLSVCVIYIYCVRRTCVSFVRCKWFVG
jgi:hypothetical protein